MQILKEMTALSVEPTPGLLDIKNTLEITVEEVLPFTQGDLSEKNMIKYNTILEGIIMRYS